MKPTNIVTIRGTSGSGKSYIVFRAMNRFASKEPVVRPGRKRPLFYLMNVPIPPSPPIAPELAVLGHYETACGGCDSIPAVETVFALAQEHAEAGRNVLFEGLLLAADVNRTRALSEAVNGKATVHCIYLATTTDVCLASVNARREARGVLTPVNPDNTVRKARSVTRAHERMKVEAPLVKSYLLNRDEALNLTCSLLGL